MTEIPEHLLKRSRARREALGLDGGQGGGDSGSESSGSEADAAAPAEEAPVAAATPARPEPAAVPATPEPEPAPEPLPPYVEAAMRRRKIPIWAMPVVAMLPVWAIVYAGTLSPPEETATGPLAEGEALYSTNCSSCHGGGGGGGVGPALSGGAVVETFPEFAEHAEWIRLGSSNWPEDTYGALETPVTRSGGMPAFENLTDEELALIVRYEREQFGGVVEEELVAITEGAGTLEAGGEGTGDGGDSPEGETGGAGGSTGQTEGADTGESPSEGDDPEPPDPSDTGT